MAHYGKGILAAMAKSDLETLASNEFGLSPEGMTKAQIIDAILTFQDEATHLGAGAPETKAKVGDTEIVTNRFVDPGKAMESDKVQVQFHNVGGPTGDFPVECGVNGRAYRYPREEPVWVPRFVLKALDEGAIEVHYVQVKERGLDGEPEMVLRGRPQKRFPYTVLQDPKLGQVA